MSPAAQALGTLVSSTVAALALGACWGGGDRGAGTVDSAVVHASTRGDSSRIFTVPPPTDTAAAAGSGAATANFPDPVSILTADSVAGQRVYRRAAGCVACHGVRGEGVAGLGSPISDQNWTHGDGSLSFLFRVIRDGISEPQAGRTLMPGTADQLKVGEIFQLATYVYSMSHVGVTVADSSALRAGAPPIAQAPPDTLRR